MRRLFYGIMFVVTLPLLPLFWALCRLEAKPCPRCGEKWFTELVGEWGVEMWECRTCRHYWETEYARRSDR